MRTTERAYRHEVAEQLRQFAKENPNGPGSWLRRAFVLRGCGETVLVPSCADCKLLDFGKARILVSCGLRTCPGCARIRMGRVQGRLCYAAARSRQDDDSGFYLLTFTLRFDPYDSDETSVEGLKRRQKKVAEGVRYVWRRVLQGEGRSLAVSYEVAPGGMVHAHAIFHGPMPRIEDVRAAWMLHHPDSPQVDSAYVRDPEGAIREVAK